MKPTEYLIAGTHPPAAVAGLLHGMEENGYIIVKEFEHIQLIRSDQVTKDMEWTKSTDGPWLPGNQIYKDDDLVFVRLKKKSDTQKELEEAITACYGFGADSGNAEERIASTILERFDVSPKSEA